MKRILILIIAKILKVILWPPEMLLNTIMFLVVCTCLILRFILRFIIFVFLEIKVKIFKLAGQSDKAQSLLEWFSEIGI